MKSVGNYSEEPNWLKHWRTKKGLTIEQLYKASKVSPSTISKIENYQCSANPTTAYKLATALGIPTAHLLKLTNRKAVKVLENKALKKAGM